MKWKQVVVIIKNKKVLYKLKSNESENMVYISDLNLCHYKNDKNYTIIYNCDVYYNKYCIGVNRRIRFTNCNVALYCDGKLSDEKEDVFFVTIL